MGSLKSILEYIYLCMSDTGQLRWEHKVSTKLDTTLYIVPTADDTDMYQLFNSPSSINPLLQYTIVLSLNKCISYFIV